MTMTTHSGRAAGVLDRRKRNFVPILFRPQQREEIPALPEMSFASASHLFHNRSRGVVPPALEGRNPMDKPKPFYLSTNGDDVEHAGTSPNPEDAFELRIGNGQTMPSREEIIGFIARVRHWVINSGILEPGEHDE